MTKVLVIDDDRAIRELTTSALGRDGREILVAEDAESGIAAILEHRPEAVLLDIHLPDRSGLSAFDEVRELDRELPVVFMTSDESGESVIEALEKGAFDYVAKPLDLARLRRIVDRAVASRRKSNVEVSVRADRDTVVSGFVGHGPGMVEVFRAIAQCSRQDVHVLIRGESGTGKELVARAIYEHGDRSDEAFLAVNCAALQDNLLESELFGHELGAFTGAVSQRIGKFEQCDGGTIFLDEIGDMSPSVQAKILRLLQEQEFQRLGGTETIKTDVRVISATNRPLETMCEDGSFRLDLLHRLNGYAIEVPPLRERGGDISVLIGHFLARAGEELRLEGFEGISREAMNLLLDYDWPGNVRELEAVVRKSLIDLRGPILVPEFLPPEVRAPRARGSATPYLDRMIRDRLDVSTDVYTEIIEHVERRLVEIVLESTSGNQSEAARILGITRGKLRNRIRAFEIDPGSGGED